MKRIRFYILTSIAFMCRMFHNGWYMKILVAAHKLVGVAFEGMPEYIHQDAYLDSSGGLTIGKSVVISTKVIILTHDWSFLKRSNVSALGGHIVQSRSVKIVLSVLVQ